MKKCLYCFALILLYVSCKSISVNQRPQIVTETPVILGNIGLITNNVLQKHFESVAVPLFSESLKLQVLSDEFSKQTFKIFSKANTTKNTLNIAFADSLKKKPQYIHLQFLDRVAVTNQLNNSKNTGVRSYLEHKEDAQLVTSVAIAFSDQNISKILTASEVFLIQSSSKKFSLQLKDTAGNEEILEFSDGVIFAYQLSSFCWSENDKHKVVIGDIINNTENCPANTYKKASKAIQKENYFKL